MFEAVKELAEIIKHLPEYTIWVLLGLLAYKLFVVGSIYGCIRLAINRLSEFLMKEKVVIKKIELEGHFIDTATYHSFMALINSVKKSSYVHSSDLENIRKAVEKIKSEALK